MDSIFDRRPRPPGVLAPVLKRMRNRAAAGRTMKAAFLLALVAGACVATPVLAHHSFAMFDRNKTIAISGVVKEYEWTNPHVWLHIMAPDKDGKSVQWSFE